MFVPAEGTRGAHIDGLQIGGRDAQRAAEHRPARRRRQLRRLPAGGRAAGEARDRRRHRRRPRRRRRPPDPRSASRASPRVQEVSRGAPWLLFGLAPLATVGGPSLVTTPLLPQTGGIGTRAVAIAEQYLGVRYVWGGASPLSGFDCSGLVMYVYAQLGIQLTHFSGAQFDEGTRILQPEDLLPGDLVFFHPGPSGPGHVGIYIGGGQFLHAPHTGDVVKISSLDEYAVQLRRRRAPVLTRRGALTIPALLAASALCVLLVVYRRHHTGDPFYDFLVWNLVLAWVPLVLALAAYAEREARRRAGRRRPRRPLAAVLPERAVPADGLHPPARVADDAALVRRADARRVRVDRRSCSDSRRSTSCRRSGSEPPARSVSWLGVDRRARARELRRLPRPLPALQQLGRARASRPDRARHRTRSSRTRSSTRVSSQRSSC